MNLVTAVHLAVITFESMETDGRELVIRIRNLIDEIGTPIWGNSTDKINGFQLETKPNFLLKKH